LKWSGARCNGTQIPFNCLDIQLWNGTKLSLLRLGSERNERNYNILIPILPLFKNIEVEEIIKIGAK
jgi:hypothetical protein